jgi:putative ABC transport system permease protein
LAAKSLRRRRTRTILTVSGIVVGVAMILVLLSLSTGTSTQTSGLLRNLVGAEITVVNGTTPTFPGGSGGFSGTFTNTGGFGGGGFGQLFGAGNTLNASVVDSVGKVSGVYAVSPQLTTTGYVNGETTFLYGIDPTTYSNVTSGLNIASGSMLSASSTENPIVLSTTIATALDVTVGSTVTVGPNSTGGSSFIVIGTYNPGSTFGPDSRSAYILLPAAQSIAGQANQVTEIYVKTESPSLVSSVASLITSTIPGVEANTATSVTGAASTLSGTLSTFFTVIGLVALMAGGFGVINTMLMSISERTREIGTLRAMGATKGEVMRIFMTEAFVIGLIGAGVGVLIGVTVAVALPHLSGSTTAATGGFTGGFPGAGAGNALRGGLETALTADNLLLSLGLGVLVGALAGVYPAWRASRMSPVEALRHV